MRQAFKTFLTLTLAIVVMLIVRAFVLTMYTISTDISPDFRQGDRLLVSKIRRGTPEKGAGVVFDSGLKQVGKVLAVPGDTLSVGGQKYLIPQKCCPKCLCPGCHLYLIGTGKAHQIVPACRITGIIVHTFRLPW